MRKPIFPPPPGRIPLDHPKMPGIPGSTTINIRKANTGDIESIITIEEQRFPHPWGRKFFSDEITHDISYFYVAEDIDDIPSARLTGYIIFWIIAEEMELHKIAVSEDYQGQGIGKELMRFMLDTAAQKKVEKIFLEVRKSNHTAVRLYESFHFKLTGTRKKYYSDPEEDALIYCLDTFFKR